MDAVLTSLVPAATVAPVHGIGSAVRSCGIAESEAAAGFAGILAAVPAAPAAPCAPVTPGGVATAPGKQFAGPGVAIGAAATDQVPMAMAAVAAPTEKPVDAIPAAAVPTVTAPNPNGVPGVPVPAATAEAVASAVPVGATLPEAAETIPEVAQAASGDSGAATVETATMAVATATPAQADIAALAQAQTDVATLPAATPAATPAAISAATPELSPGTDPSQPATVSADASPAAPEAIAMARVQVLATTPAIGSAAPVPTADTPVAADPEVPASAAAPLSVAAALDAASPVVAMVAADAETGTAVVTDKPAAAHDAEDDAPDAAAIPADTEPALHGPTAAEQAMLGYGLHTYLKSAGLPAARAAAAESAQPATSGDASATAGRPAAFAALVNDFLAADAAATTGNGLGVRLAGDLSDPATAAQLRAQGNGASAASIRSQVAEQISRGLLNGKGEEKLTIRLNPEELGQVDVELRAVNDRLTVTLRAATPEAEQALRSGARELTDSIIERSGRFQHVEVRVESRDGGTLRTERPDDRHQEQKQDGKQQDGRRAGRDEARGQTEDADSAREAWVRAFTDLSQLSQEA
jgi:flagellar hook-length control protein FliK